MAVGLKFERRLHFLTPALVLFAVGDQLAGTERCFIDVPMDSGENVDVRVLGVKVCKCLAIADDDKAAPKDERNSVNSPQGFAHSSNILPRLGVNL